MVWGIVTLVRKDLSSGNSITNFRPITLRLKILTKVLAKGLVLVTEKRLVKEAQPCSMPSRTIQDNCHLI